MKRGSATGVVRAETSDTVRKVDYFTIRVADRPGEAFRVLQVLVSGGINLLACSGRRVGRRSQIDVVPEDARKFKRVVGKADLEFAARKSGFLIQGEDRPGALAQNLRRLAKAGINVAGVDGMAAGKGRWGAIVWVASRDVVRAEEVFGAKVK
jgi:prephenate dehydratase